MINCDKPLKGLSAAILMTPNNIGAKFERWKHLHSALYTQVVHPNDRDQVVISTTLADKIVAILQSKSANSLPTSPKVKRKATR